VTYPDNHDGSQAVNPQALTFAAQEKVRQIVERVERLEAIGAIWPSHAGLLVTVCNQEEADRDVPRLLEMKQQLDIPWVGLSMEPLLGPVDLTALPFGEPIGNVPSYLDSTLGKIWMPKGLPTWATDSGATVGERTFVDLCANLDWIIVGGESGPGARPMHPDWARSLRDQCAGAGVPFFFKQWGEWVSVYDRATDPDWKQTCEQERLHPKGRWINLAGGHGFHGERVHYIAPLGKTRAGRTLDGITHDAMPGATGCQMKDLIT
jgi:protein gp37